MPGTSIIELASSPPRSAPTETGVLFATGISDEGPSDRAILCRSLDEYISHFGARTIAGMLYDGVETYFRVGGSKLYVSRVVSPGAVTATVNLPDAGAAVSLVYHAPSSGAAGNNYSIAVLAPDVAGFKLQILKNGVPVATSTDLADQNSAVAWAAGAGYGTLTLGASGLNPAVAAARPAAGGNDDRTGILEAQWTAALANFTKDLGPGQVAAFGRTTLAAQSALLAHAKANNRVALIDLADTGVAGTLVTAAAALKSDPNSRYGAAFAPWAKVPGVVAGQIRTVPYSAVQAGLIARSDISNSPNVPAAGENGQADWVLDLSQPAWDDNTRNNVLNANGVNVAIVKYGGVRTYGYRTLTDPVVNPNWVEFSNVRLYMAIAALGDAIAERYVLSQIDGKGRKIGQFGGELTGMLVPFFEEGSLYGDTPSEAFNVDVGPQVNTVQSIQARQLKAVIALRMSPFAEDVILELVKTAITEAVA